MPISELPSRDYELHNIKLKKPTETIPVGFKLSKQTDPLQYIMTLVVERSRADMAGLRVDDWLIKIDDRDIRLTALQDVLQDIYRLFNTVGVLNMLIARKKPAFDENKALSSVGLSNRTDDRNSNPPIPKQPPSTQPFDPNLNKVRRITLKDTSALHIKSFMLTHDDQIQIHFISNIQPISGTYHAGLRNNDRILTINGVDVAKTSFDDLQSMLSKTPSIILTVIKDSNYLEYIENFNRNELRKVISSTFREPINQQQQLKEFNNTLFIDDQGPVYIKHCVIKREPSSDALGFSLYSEDGFHVINNVERNSPGYHCGLRNRDIILFVNQKNVQQMTHDHLTTLLRSLATSNQLVDLITINGMDIQRYKTYQQKRFIDWYSILSKIDEKPTNKTPSISSGIFNSK